MKLKNIIAILLSICLMPIVGICTESGMEIRINMVSKVAEIRVHFNEGVKNQRVSIQVLNPMAEPLDAENIEQKLQYTAQLTLDNTGSADVTFKLKDNAQTGDYTVYAIAEDFDKELSDVFHYATDESAMKYIMQLNNPNGTSEAEKLANIGIMLEDADISNSIGADQTYFLRLQNKTEVYKEILKADFTTRSEFCLIFDGIVAAIAIITKIDGAENILNYYCKSLNCPKLYKYYSGFTEKTKINSFLTSKTNMTNGDELRKDLGIGVINNYPTQIETWIQFETFLMDISEEIGLETKEYQKLSDKSVCLQSIIKKLPMETLDEFKGKFRVEIGNSQPAPPPVSGGGGGGGGGTTQTTIPPIPKLEEKIHFTDISDVSWAEKAILSLAEKNIIAGDGEGKFYPNAFVLREEFVKMVVGAFEIPNLDADCQFTDVNKNEWYYPYITAACGNGLIKGMSNSHFGIGENITRQDMAVILYHVLPEYKVENPQRFDDNDSIWDYARTAVEALNEQKIINGVGDNLFAPLEFATRAQAVKMIYESCAILKGGKE